MSTFCMMQFISRIPWDSTDPDIIEVLDLLIDKGVDFCAGENSVRISRHTAPDDCVWYHVDAVENSFTKKHTFLQENQRLAIRYFVSECNRIATPATE